MVPNLTSLRADAGAERMPLAPDEQRYTVIVRSHDREIDPRRMLLTAWSQEHSTKLGQLTEAEPFD
jgi:hypothetical protein